MELGVLYPLVLSFRGGMGENNEKGGNLWEILGEGSLKSSKRDTDTDGTHTGRASFFSFFPHLSRYFVFFFLLFSIDDM